MNIVYLNKVLIDTHLPAVNFTLFNAYGLAQAGATCYLIAQKKNPQFQSDILYKHFQLSPPDTLKTIILQQGRWFGVKTNQWFYINAFKIIRKLHKVQKIDAVISRDPGALPYLSRLLKRKGIAVFYQPHNFYVDLSVRQDVNPKNAVKYHLLEKKYIGKISGLFCLQQPQAELFSKYFPDQHIYVVRPGLIRIKASNHDRFRNRLIGYIGSLQLKKGVDTLLSAFNLLRNQDYKLVLVGGRNADEIEPVMRKIEEWNLTGTVEITGWLPYSEVENYLDKITVGVLPLTDTFYNRYLTAPNKLYDYLSQGIPMIAADLPSIRDCVDRDIPIQFFPPDNAEALARSISMILSDRKTYMKISEGAISKAGKYTWQNSGKQMIGIIKNAAINH